jgi:hypothetical protein
MHVYSIVISAKKTCICACPQAISIAHKQRIADAVDLLKSIGNTAITATAPAARK